MDEKKQKILLAVVGVLALGAGTYYFGFRDSGGANIDLTNAGPVERKKVDRSKADTKVERKKEVRTAANEEPKTVERKAREEEDPTTVQRKAKRTEKKEEKKKTIQPAA